MGGFRPTGLGVRLLTVSLGLLVGLGHVPLGQGAQPQRGGSEAFEESFWYSLQIVESVVLYSGLGQPAPPHALRAAGFTPTELAGMLPLEALFRSGIPRFQVVPDLENPITLRWRSPHDDPVVTLEALGWAVLAELGWAARLRSLLPPPQTPTVTLAGEGSRAAPASPPSRRLQGLTLEREAQLLAWLASRTAVFVDSRLKRPDGLYAHEWRVWRGLPLVEGPPPWRGQLVWLWALFALILEGDEQPLQVHRLRESAAELAQALDERLPWRTLEPEEAALAIQALTWGIAAFPDGSAELDDDVKGRLVRRLVELAERLLDLNPQELQMEALAAVVKGLLHAYALTQVTAYREGGLRAWQALQERWDVRLKLFRPQPDGADDPPVTLTARAVAELLGAFHALIAIEDDEQARRLYPAFLEGLKASGLVQAEGPEAGGDADADPVPSLIGAGRAPVPIGAVRYEPAAELEGRGQGRWQPLDERFYSAPAFQMALFWLWLGRLPLDIETDLDMTPLEDGVLSPLPVGRPDPRLAARVTALEGELIRLKSALERSVQALRERHEEAYRETTAELRELRRQVALQLEVLRRELQQSLATRPTQDDLEGLRARIDALDDQLSRLKDRPTIPPRLEAQVDNLIERVSALEAEVARLGRWTVRPERLLLALGIVGLGLVVAGLIRLIRRRQAHHPSSPRLS